MDDMQYREQAQKGLDRINIKCFFPVDAGVTVGSTIILTDILEEDTIGEAVDFLLKCQQSTKGE